MATTPVDLGGNTLYTQDVYIGDTTPNNTSGQSVTTQLGTINQGLVVAELFQTLTALQSGGTFVFDRAAGTTVTLPTPAPGLQYTFVIGTVATSNTQKVVTANTTAHYISGGLFFDKSLTVTRYDGNTTSLAAISMNGTTTGGATIGDTLTLYGVSSTIWAAERTCDCLRYSCNFRLLLRNSLVEGIAEVPSSLKGHTWAFRVVLTEVENFTNESTAANAINNNSTTIETGFDSTTNINGDTYNGTLDMNSNHIINLPAPTSINEPVRVYDGVYHHSMVECTIILSG